MPREAVTVQNLGVIDDLIKSRVDSNRFFHIYGILKKETEVSKQWELFDEYKEIKVKLAGSITEYPRPKPGDIIRIRRLKINGSLDTAEVPTAKNVVIWHAFQHKPKPVTVAKNPTLEEDDTERRRTLEVYFSTRIRKLIDIQNSRDSGEYIFAVAGCVESKQVDSFGHIELQITDGTASLTLRVFKKKEDAANESDAHYQVASTLEKGHLVVATNVKSDVRKRLNLSANLMQGKSLRKVEPSSILGVKLTESLGFVVEPSQPTNTSNTGSQPRRRSPRFTQDENQSPNVPSQELVIPPIAPIASQSSIPKFTQFSDIKKRETGYEFYDLVGQIRDKPRITAPYGNCVLQIFDGSLHEFTNYYASEVEREIEGCCIVLIYCKQFPHETNEHFEKAICLKEGDIVHISNAKVSFVDSKLRVELNANTSHNKALHVIDKRTSFGRKILNMAETPQVAELRDPILDSPHQDSEDDFPE